MKIVHTVLIAATTVIGAAAPALADTDATSPDSLWVLTRDPTFAHLAGLTDKQLKEQATMKSEVLPLQ